MNALSYQADQDDWDAPSELPPRPRRRLLTPVSATLIAVLLGAVGFYLGIRVEKRQLAGGSQAQSAGPTGPANGKLAAARPGARPGGPPGSLSGAAGNGSLGTVSSVDRTTIYVKDSSGNTIKVKLSNATRITKTLTVPRRSIRPGDSVSIQGLQDSGGTLIASSVSDSGNNGGNSSSSSASSSSASRSGGGSSAVQSLFGSGSSAKAANGG